MNPPWGTTSIARAAIPIRFLARIRTPFRRGLSFSTSLATARGERLGRQFSTRVLVLMPDCIVLGEAFFAPFTKWLSVTNPPHAVAVSDLRGGPRKKRKLRTVNAVSRSRWNEAVAATLELFEAAAVLRRPLMNIRSVQLGDFQIALVGLAIAKSRSRR